MWKMIMIRTKCKKGGSPVAYLLLMRLPCGWNHDGGGMLGKDGKILRKAWGDGGICFLSLLKMSSNVDFMYSFFFLRKILKEYFKTNLYIPQMLKQFSLGGNIKWNFNDLLIISVSAYFSLLNIQHLRGDKSNAANMCSLSRLSLGQTDCLPPGLGHGPVACFGWRVDGPAWVVSSLVSGLNLTRVSTASPQPLGPWSKWPCLRSFLPSFPVFLAGWLV